MSDIKQHIKGRVTFDFYRDQHLYYRCEDGFEFPIPIADADGTFLAQDNAILFMRWIRKQMELQKSWRKDVE